ncbi:NUDIX hydrolase [Hydrogenophaga pseudoflava]|uniref:NUDIX hydrolase n=1 Tax=Hydrogenophaga pseudoflava TaxID=47421 RepID=UPI0008250337|nr:NUDIX hydrolase [Hydrogenophaga pseudoflava]
MKSLHPRNDDAGRQVDLKAPSAPTSLESWGDPLERATVIPDGPMPTNLNGIDVRSWTDAPKNTAGWNRFAGEQTEDFTEPPMTTAPSKPAASGVVILESDGRVWVVSPSNQHGGYVNTFPKGKLDPGMGLRANALKEAFEESGLQVILTGFLCDSVRSTSVTRYYTARREGGHPADMCWESQAVHLVPRDQLKSFVTHPNDQVVLQALAALG